MVTYRFKLAVVNIIIKKRGLLGKYGPTDSGRMKRRISGRKKLK
jgi:hypothetical protein